jgi:hypothetical protein
MKFGPQTIEEAKKHRYGCWAGRPDGVAYRPNRCIVEVYRNHISGQCSNKAGPDGLCGTHRRKRKNSSSERAEP